MGSTGLLILALTGCLHEGWKRLQLWSEIETQDLNARAILTVGWNQQHRFKRDTDRFVGDPAALRLLLPPDDTGSLTLVAPGERERFFLERCEGRDCQAIEAAGNLRKGVRITPEAPIGSTPVLRPGPPRFQQGHRSGTSEDPQEGAP